MIKISNSCEFKIAFLNILEFLYWSQLKSIQITTAPVSMEFAQQK